jgi:ABC-2 type transport system ATP-binding protein
MGEDVIQVACDRPHEALAVVEQLPEVSYAALFGSSVHVVARKSERSTETMAQRLEQHGLKATRVEKVSPTLEDVFVSVIEARDRKEAGTP